MAEQVCARVWGRGTGEGRKPMKGALPSWGTLEASRLPAVIEGGEPWRGAMEERGEHEFFLCFQPASRGSVGSVGQRKPLDKGV